MGLPRLLITGSRGRIGTVLTDALPDSFEVYGVDIQDTAGERSFRVDIADYEQLSGALQLLAPIQFHSSPCC